MASTIRSGYLNILVMLPHHAYYAEAEEDVLEYGDKIEEGREGLLRITACRKAALISQSLRTIQKDNFNLSTRIRH